MIHPPESLAIADRMADAIARRDPDAFASLYSDDAVIWHNFSNRTQTAQENIELLSKIFRVTSELGYRNIVRLPTPEGFVQYHALTGIFTDGAAMTPIHACIVATVRDGRISRLNEWLDSAQFGEVWKRIRHL